MTDVAEKDVEIIIDVKLNDGVDLLEGFNWQWIANLKFRPGLTEDQALSRLREWCNKLDTTLGTEDFEFIVSAKYGRKINCFQFQLSITGLLPGGGAAERLEWIRTWFELCGDARISILVPTIDGIPHIRNRHHVPKRGVLESRHGTRAKTVQSLAVSKGHA